MKQFHMFAKSSYEDSSLSTDRYISSPPLQLLRWRLKQVLFLCEVRDEVIQTERNISVHTAWRRIGGIKVQLHSYLTSALDVVKWAASLPGRFAPSQNAPGASSMEGCVGPTAGVDVEMRRDFCLWRDSKPGSNIP